VSASIVTTTSPVASARAWLRVVAGEHRADRVGDRRLLVVSGDEDAHEGRHADLRRALAQHLLGEGEAPDEDRAQAHERDAGDEDGRDADAGPVVEVEHEPVDARSPPLAGREHGHDGRTRLAEQFAHRHEREAFGPQAVDDDGDRGHRCRAVATPVVQEHDVPDTRSRVVQHALCDLRGRRRRAATRSAPVVGVDARADDHVAHRLRHRQERDFLRGLRVVVDPVGRTEEERTGPEEALE
jgi:hypothetical protein